MGKILIMKKSELKEIEQEICIVEAGDIAEKVCITGALDRLPSYLIVVSRSNHTLLRVDDARVNLFENQIIIYALRDLGRINIVRGEGLYIHLAGKLAERYIQSDKINEIIIFDLDDNINNSIRELEARLDLDRKLEPVTAAKIAFSILLDLWMHQSQTKRTPRLVIDAIKIIEDEYGFLFGIEDIADKLGINKSYLIRLFKDNLGITPGRYLEKHRVNKAKALLSSGEFNVDMIAKLCGFSCANYFGKVFKKNTRVSPSQYIRSNNEELQLDIPQEYYL